MMKTTSEELAIVGYSADNNIVQITGQFKAGNCKDYFDALKKNFQEKALEDER